MGKDLVVSFLFPIFTLLLITNQINVMKNLVREDLVIALNGKFPKLNCMRTEDFNGTEGGIWISGEDDVTDKNGKQLFSYYNDGSTYTFGVVNHLVKFLRDRGWFAEWYDAGTVMLWED